MMRLFADANDHNMSTPDKTEKFTAAEEQTAVLVEQYQPPICHYQSYQSLDRLKAEVVDHESVNQIDVNKMDV